MERVVGSYARARSRDKEALAHARAFYARSLTLARLLDAARSARGDFREHHHGNVRLEVASRVGYLRGRGAAPRPMTRATSMWAIRESGGVTFGAPGYAHRIFLIDIIHRQITTNKIYNF